MQATFDKMKATNATKLVHTSLAFGYKTNSKILFQIIPDKAKKHLFQIFAGLAWVGRIWRKTTISMQVPLPCCKNISPAPTSPQLQVIWSSGPSCRTVSWMITFTLWLWNSLDFLTRTSTLNKISRDSHALCAWTNLGLRLRNSKQKICCIAWTIFLLCPQTMFSLVFFAFPVLTYFLFDLQFIVLLLYWPILHSLFF